MCGPLVVGCERLSNYLHNAAWNARAAFDESHHLKQGLPSGVRVMDRFSALWNRVLNGLADEQVEALKRKYGIAE
eukprot:4061125-Amphidinium_carterae.1